MTLRSNFKHDLKKEQNLAVFLNPIYKKHLKNYTFERVNDLEQQLQGIDLILTHKDSKKKFYLDEKAQLDYINKSLPTFAFELSYEKNGKRQKGWLFDSKKKTHFYALITAIYSDAPAIFTSCHITFVNRKKLICFLQERNINQKTLGQYVERYSGNNSRMEIEQLDVQKEGYIFFSSKNKAEKPINLVLKLDFLIKNHLAKPFP